MEGKPIEKLPALFRATLMQPYYECNLPVGSPDKCRPRFSKFQTFKLNVSVLVWVWVWVWVSWEIRKESTTSIRTCSILVANTPPNQIARKKIFLGIRLAMVVTSIFEFHQILVTIIWTVFGGQMMYNDKHSMRMWIAHCMSWKIRNRLIRILTTFGNWRFILIINFQIYWFPLILKIQFLFSIAQATMDIPYEDWITTALPDDGFPAPSNETNDREGINNKAGQAQP